MDIVRCPSDMYQSRLYHSSGQRRVVYEVSGGRQKVVVEPEPALVKANASTSMNRIRRPWQKGQGRHGQ